MKRIQFWILLVGSVLVCLLYVEQVYLSWTISRQQQLLAASQQMISLGPTYEASWKQMAARVYELSRSDSALADVLKRNQISVQIKKPAGDISPASQPAPIGQSKAPGGP